MVVQDAFNLTLALPTLHFYYPHPTLTLSGPPPKILTLPDPAFSIYPHSFSLLISLLYHPLYTSLSLNPHLAPHSLFLFLTKHIYPASSIHPYVTSPFISSPYLPL